MSEQGANDQWGAGHGQDPASGQTPSYGQDPAHGPTPIYGETPTYVQDHAYGQGYGQPTGQGYGQPDGSAPAYGSAAAYGSAPAYGQGYGQAAAYGSVPGYGPGSGHVPGYGYGYGPAPTPGYVYGPAQPPGYGATPYWPAVPLTWPHGPGRPSIATAAAVLGFVTGGLTALASLGFLIVQASGDGDAVTGVLALGLPCAAGLVYGGVRLLGRGSSVPLFGSALAAIGVLLLALVVAVGTFDDGDEVAGFVFFLVFAAVLPVLTAVFARVPATTGWTGSAPPA